MMLLFIKDGIVFWTKDRITKSQVEFFGFEDLTDVFRCYCDFSFECFMSTEFDDRTSIDFLDLLDFSDSELDCCGRSSTSVN